MQDQDKIIIITQGDPNGIGPEIILKSIDIYENYLIVGNIDTLNFYSKILCINKDINTIKDIKDIRLSKTKLNLFALPYDEKIQPGKLSKKAGELALKCIDTAVRIINNTKIKKLVTLPVNKEAIIMSYNDFMGHTEYLGKLLNKESTTMIMSSTKINVALVTTHIPLKAVPEMLTKNLILKTIKHANLFLSKTGTSHKPIGVCSLNPHGGEGGHFGGEEKSIIIPAITHAKKMGINVEGPISADSIFSKNYPLYVALYHDQGLIPFKLQSFHKGVNITMGLPFYRVSVDHGTAFDIAGQNKANVDSFKEAIKRAKSFI